MILGVILIILDIFIGLDFFVLPVGVASIIVSILIYAQANMWFGDNFLFDTWKQIIIWFSVLSLFSVVIIKIIFQRHKKRESDINQY